MHENQIKIQIETNKAVSEKASIMSYHSPEAINLYWTTYMIKINNQDFSCHFLFLRLFICDILQQILLNF